ncbi:MAG: TPM domain-containing protein [Planctomycetes bacterium]|nr:TPM domain-containing protein [Planctomycetota bacterium]
MGRHSGRWIGHLTLTLTPAQTTLMVWAIPVEEIPNPQEIAGNWVSDVAEILQPETEVQINAQINRLHASRGDEIAVVTLPDSQPFSSPKQLHRGHPP